MLRSPRRIALWGIVAVACIIPLWSALLGQTHLLAGDMTLDHAPWNHEFAESRSGTAPVSDFVDWQLGYQEIVQDRAWDGDLAEWDDLSGAGAPLMALPHTGLYSPLGWVTWIVPPEYSPAVLKLIEFGVAIGGMFLLGRLIGLSSGASLVGGATYAFSGFQIMWSTSHQPFTAALIPWVFWASERLIRRRRWVDVIPLALATAVMALGGFMAVTAYALYAAALYLVVRVLYLGAREHRAALVQKADVAREFVKSHVADALRWGTAIVLGMATIAVLMVPYLRVIASSVLPERGAAVDSAALPPMTLTTLAFPHSFGVLNHDIWFGPVNEIEAVGYVGAASLLLALFGVVVVRWRSDLSVVLVPLVVTLVPFLLLAYTDLPGVSALVDLPGISGSPRGRMRSVNGFLIATLAAIGAHVLITRARSLARWERLVPVGVAGVAGLGAVAYLRNYASQRDEWEGIARWILVDVIAAVVVGLLILGLRRGGRGLRAVPFVLLGTVCVEAMFFVLPYLPRTDPSLSMPETAAHRFLSEHMGPNDRQVSNRHDLFPGTTKYFGLPSVTGHFWHVPEWKEYLETLDPTAFIASRTFSTLDLSSRERMTSPMLDRAAARYAVVNLALPVFGELGPAVPLEPSDADRVLSASVSAGEIRGFAVAVEDVLLLPDGVRHADVHIEVLDADGSSLGTTYRRAWESVPAGEMQIAFAGEHLAPQQLEVRVWLEDVTSGDVLDLDAQSVRPILAEDDGLRLVEVAGVAIWERTGAMDRYRWAEAAVVETDASARLELLASGTVSADEVVLDEPTRNAGGPGSIVDIDETDPDHRTITVESEDGGWLVVADTMQTGWSATVDGESADLQPADHAFVAVYVPAGTHEVVLDYQAPGTGLGRAVSIVGVSGLVAIAVLERRRRRQLVDVGE